jgi:hypothetical protein
MSDLFRRTSVPTWKNSPLKTVPDGFKKVTVSNQRKGPSQQSKRLQNVSITSEDMRTMLKDVPNLFDDDEDNNAAESEREVDETPPGAYEHPADMALMFASPDASILRDEPVELREEDNRHGLEAKFDMDTAGVAPDTHSSSANIRLLLQSAAEQAEQLQLNRQTETIDIATVLQNHPELLDSVQFLARFEEEFESKHDIKNPLASREGDREYEEKILHKLDSYVKLPAGALYTMVLRQHEEIVDSGMFGDS